MTDLPFELDNFVDDGDEDDGLDALDEAYVVDEAYWQVGSGGSPGNADDGTYYLVRIKDRYRVFHHSGGETSDEGDVQASSDEEAIRQFRADWN
jgi:hypothetical protein